VAVIVDLNGLLRTEAEEKDKVNSSSDLAVALIVDANRVVRKDKVDKHGSKEEREGEG
jgi:hypothetical protein